MNDPISKTAIAGVAAAGAGAISWPVVAAAAAGAAVTWLVLDWQHRKFLQEVECALIELARGQDCIDVEIEQ